MSDVEIPEFPDLQQPDLLHLECPSGLAGDMFLGACLDLGMELEPLSQAIASLGLEGVSLEARPARRKGISGTRFRVLFHGSPLDGPDPDEAPGTTGQGVARPARPKDERTPPQLPHRNLEAIEHLLRDSGLNDDTRERSLGLFRRLAEVEGRIHGVAAETVHFHEVGAVDSIVDLVGAAIAIELLAPSRLTCGTVVVGSGTVDTEHGLLPVPAPATAALLVGVPTVGGGQGELVTPTGALILAELCDGFGPQPAMTTCGQGFGLGRRELPDRANAVRLSSGRSLSGCASSGSSRWALSPVWVIETQVDDVAPEPLGFLMEQLLELGALDVFFCPAQMKKNRPGTLITALAREGDQERLARELLRETGSLGCRFQRVERLELDRRVERVMTPYGEVKVKIGVLDGETFSTAPEYEDCRARALENKVSWREVFAAALESARAREQ